MNQAADTRQVPPADSAAVRQPGQFALTLVDRVVNFLFGTTYTAGTIRRQVLLTAVFITWTLIAFFSHPIQDWQVALFNVIDPPPDAGSPLLTLISTVFLSYFAWDVLGHVIALGLPIWLALQIAAIFLDDIFELRDAETAVKFITRAAFVFPTFGVMNIENGHVRPRDQKSTIFRVGGPGSVRVMLENV
ncbi:MAG TPA: hypothetical protein VHO48_12900, partial [Anaerolineaceae bacterium]|nr:hypothetical protein [Anaerolineaceae bacterium]